MKVGRRTVLKRSWEFCCFILYDVMWGHFWESWDCNNIDGKVELIPYFIQVHHRNISREKIHDTCGRFLLLEISLRPNLIEKYVWTRAPQMYDLWADSLVYFGGCLRRVCFTYVVKLYNSLELHNRHSQIHHVKRLRTTLTWIMYEKFLIDNSL